MFFVGLEITLIQREVRIIFSSSVGWIYFVVKVQPKKTMPSSKSSSNFLQFLGLKSSEIHSCIEIDWDARGGRSTI